MYSWTCTKQHCLAAEVTNSLALLPFWRSFSLRRQNIKRDIRKLSLLSLAGIPSDPFNAAQGDCKFTFELSKRKKKEKGEGGVPRYWNYLFFFSLFSVKILQVEVEI